ncbi:thioredoxin-like protein [Dunaliella salina]|uniref:Glutathione peroxidase n=1 Tax=Dunaliella salina TaxID=3046 RepID=A0ABQ7H878_DUNSA|nr:thioredoxin-like protein [Dunaliella salina]KAF5843059.1 thioredoxin-like protein [Dunaliella salina]|eukprot:KAF5843058.1 thioredoxin-like protein [Dunaliella salina]
MGMGPRRSSFSRESTNGTGPLLPLYHSSSVKWNQRRGCNIPNWTVVLLLISSCVCYSLIAYAIGRSNAKDEIDDEGVVTDSMGQSLQQEHKLGGSTATKRDEENTHQYHQHLQQQPGKQQQLQQQQQQQQQQQRQWEEEEARRRAGGTQQQHDQLLGADRQQGGQQQPELDEEQQEERLQQQEELDRAMKGGGLFALTAKDIHGNVRTLDEFRGKVVIVTNVASKCGFTDSNYKGLQATYEKYSAYGLEVLAFPCDQFGHQEPGTEEEISQFCTENYKVTFPLFSKVDVNGPNTHPVFQVMCGVSAFKG